MIKIEKADIEWLITLIVMVIIPILQSRIKTKKPFKRRRKHK